MTLEQLKNSIQTKQLDDTLVIFKYEDVPFICYQYIKEISKILDKEIEYVEDLSSLVNNVSDIFGISETTDSVRVHRCEIFDIDFDTLKDEKYFFVITKKIEGKAKSLYNDYIVTVPKLEGWHIKDYVYSVAEGIDTNELDWFIDICKSDINRIENELDKIRLFSDMKYQGAFRDLSTFNVFNITNAVTNKDMNMLIDALKEIDSFDAEPLGVVTLLYQGFRKLIQVWLAKNPTPENTGLKSNVIYAINKSKRVYSKEQLIKIFLFLTDIDRQLKTGMIDTKWIIDYVVCKVLTC